MGLGIKLDVGVDESGTKVANELLETFYKRSCELKATPVEVGAAICTLQQLYYEEFGGIPISEELLKEIRNTRIVDMKGE